MFKPNSLSGRIFKKYLSLPGHPAKIRIQNIAGKSFFFKGIELRNDQNVLFTLDANDWITRIILKEGNYENESIALAKKLLFKGGLFIDIGANFGLFTCIVAHNNPKVNVIAVEPNYKVIPRLLNNIKQNELLENVQVINAAVSSEFHLLTIEQPAPDNVGTTVARAGAKGLLSVLGCPLEVICNANNISVIDLIKIDIEGNEFTVLNNFPFEKIIVKNIIIEFNYLSEISFEELRMFFDAKGFDFLTISGNILHNEKNDIPENNIWIVNRKNKTQ